LVIARYRESFVAFPLIVHLVAIVAGHPVIRLVQQNERCAFTLDRPIRRRDGFEALPATVGADQLPAVSDLVALLEAVAHQAGQQSYRVRGLRPVDRGHLHPRLRARHTNRLVGSIATVPAGRSVWTTSHNTARRDLCPAFIRCKTPLR
jgi:hypothetical protein